MASQKDLEERVKVLEESVVHLTGIIGMLAEGTKKAMEGNDALLVAIIEGYTEAP